MKKTMVYLEDEQYLQLKRVSASTKKKMAEIIRNALKLYLKRDEKPIELPQFIGIAKGPKQGKTSEQVDEILQELFK